MSYVMLTSNLTGLTYAVSQRASQARSAAGGDDAARRPNRALRSDERLAAIAARLGMHEPQRFAVIRIAAPAIVADASALPGALVDRRVLRAGADGAAMKRSLKH